MTAINYILCNFYTQPETSDDETDDNSIEGANYSLILEGNVDMEMISVMKFIL